MSVVAAALQRHMVRADIALVKRKKRHAVPVANLLGAHMNRALIAEDDDGMRIDRWFKRFAENGVRGAFFDGFGQDVEAYVTFRLLDDPSRKLDDILDEYFTRLYPRAAVPMRRLYDEIERIYSSPESYPPGFKSHQTEEVAWTSLGTPANMARLGAHMDEARAAAAASSPLEQRRVEIGRASCRERV